jgi:hypothetical protein
LEVSVSVTTHDPPQSVVPVAQPPAHRPFAQTMPVMQASSHIEQCSVSVWTLTQAPPQTVWPSLQTTAQPVAVQTGFPFGTGLHA